jgi:hypothetical protein
MKRWLIGAAAASVVALTLPFQAQASLIGDTVTFGGFLPTPPAASVGAGVESILKLDFGLGVVLDLLSVDVDAYSVTWTSLGTRIFGGGTLTLADLDFAGFPGGIVGVDFAVAGVTGFGAADFGFTADSLSVDIADTEWSPGGTLTVTFTVAAAVAEPATLALFGAAFAGLIGVRGRRRA